ncbi:LysR family transcriptional regulator [Streptomyces ipomoeae]|nr:NAD(P)H-binding protein [Streptomyces ipomoeae]MDX2695470.1 NAD(P)H-binding protein [Streptomyces ipomoeae]MDX2827827.1 NAD(P)H-binding protein [Streptomyces ipomoeae]MDX2842836.1 NAD(P)H-binding protein [Streptomyces ipomoeae]MDX2880553.1 NAD(P)H-binding protein [Streptomyces ipomoeae]MDX2937369.1 NAD(P)H-binding protein [Streptomyces ipomoeae]
MKIVVVGGTGLIGSQVVASVRGNGHEAVAAAPSTGVDTLTGKGLAEALKGADVVVDVSNSPSFEADAALDFFTRSAHNLIEAEKEAGVRHHVVLSIVGVDQVPDYGYYRAKVAQEEAVRGSGVPYSIVRATQFFEFIAPVMNMSTEGTEVHLPSRRLRPIASAEVAAAVADAAQGEPSNGVRDIAGPEVHRLDRLAEITLAVKPDGRTVVTDETAGLFASMPDGVLIGDDTTHLAPTRYEDWLEQS